MVMPMVSRMSVPVSANSVSTPKDTTQPVMAIERLTDVASPAVSAKNSGALPMGSAMTNSVTNAFNKLSTDGI